MAVRIQGAGGQSDGGVMRPDLAVAAFAAKLQLKPAGGHGKAVPDSGAAASNRWGSASRAAFRPAGMRFPCTIHPHLPAAADVWRDRALPPENRIAAPWPTGYR